MKRSGINNRTRLVDAPIIEMILNNKYINSGIKFIKSNSDGKDCTDIVCYGNGTKRGLIIKRNRSKYYRACSFSIEVDKNRMDHYDGDTYVFIDEVSDCLYIVDGVVLLNYMLEHVDNIKQSEFDGNYYLMIPKSDIVLLMIPDKASGIIKYNKSVARLFAIGRDESKFKDLV